VQHLEVIAGVPDCSPGGAAARTAVAAVARIRRSARVARAFRAVRSDLAGPGRAAGAPISTISANRLVGSESAVIEEEVIAGVVHSAALGVAADAAING